MVFFYFTFFRTTNNFNYIEQLFHISTAFLSFSFPARATNCQADTSLFFFLAWDLHHYISLYQAHAVTLLPVPTVCQLIAHLATYCWADIVCVKFILVYNNIDSNSNTFALYSFSHFFKLLSSLLQWQDYGTFW